MATKVWLAPTVLAAGLVAACNAGGASTAPAAAEERPKVLRYVYSPSGTEEPQAQSLRLDRLKDYLEVRLKMDVELYKTSAGYGAVIEAMRAKKIDVGTFGPFGYLIASEKAGAEVIVVTGTKDGNHGSYAGTIAVNSNSPIKTIDDVVTHARNLTFSFVDPASTSGFLVQRAYFQSVGLDPEKDFKKTVFSMNHLVSAMTLIAGKVDAAAFMEAKPGNTIYRTLFTRGRMREGDIRVLWKSPPLPTSPIAVRRDLSASFKQEIQQALVDIPERDPELWKMWPRSSASSEVVLVRGTDEMFDGLREMARNVKNLSLLEQ
jgi:phosphonate transport system substrate-binding protein